MEHVSQYMIDKLVEVKSDTLLIDTIQLMKKKKIGSVLVKEDRETVGIFTERDLVTRINWNDPASIASLRVRDVMSKGLKKARHDESYTEVIALMRNNNIRHLPIVREGRIIGIVSLRDLAKHQEEHLQSRLKEQEKMLLEQFKTIKESEARFRTVFDYSAVGITMTDSNENIIMCNPFVLQLLGMEKEDLIGKQVKEIYPPHEWKIIRAQHFRQIGGKHHFETRVINKQGKLLDVSIAISVLKDANGEVLGSIGFMRDITEHKKLERIRQEFVGVVSHELRTPLVPIREGVSQVLDGVFGEINKDQREYLTIVFHEINRLKRIIDDLLDIFKFEIDKIPMRKELIDINGVVKEIVTTFTPKMRVKGLDLKLQAPRRPVMLYADRDRIVQVFSNLLGNALKFTSQGGIRISIEEKQDAVECTVTDTGVGMSKANLAVLFQKFQQFRKASSQEEKGTGLGLVICKEIINLHKGTIWATSALRKGTTFHFRLPRYSPSALFKELMTDNLKAAIEQDSTFSVLLIDVEGIEKVQEAAGFEKARSLIATTELLVKNILRRSKDTAIRFDQSVLVMLPQTDKEGAVAVAGRTDKAFGEYVQRSELDASTALKWKIANFPDDGETIEELFDKIAPRLK